MLLKSCDCDTTVTVDSHACKSWKKYERAWKEYEATLTDEEKIPLWSDESFKHFMGTYIFRSPEEIRARRRQFKKKEKVTF